MHEDAESLDCRGCLRVCLKRARIEMQARFVVLTFLYTGTEGDSLMSDTDSGKSTAVRSTQGLLPKRLIIAAAAAVCIGLACSAIFNFVTLLQLHALYLSNRGNEITLSVDSQARGAGRRGNPAFWQSLLEEKFALYSGSVAFMALVDREGNRLALAGNEAVGDRGIFIFEETLGRARNPRGDEDSHIAAWRLRIGLYSADADFILYRAWILLGVSALAIVLMVAISLYLVRMINRFLEIKMRESSEAHLKSLGVMAASLAHEIRNPLGSMKGLTQLVQEDLPQDHESQGHLSTVVREAERLERLVSDLLDFARPGELQFGEFSLGAVISDVGSMLNSRFSASGVTIHYDTADGPMDVRSDEGGVRQVLLNVLMNALDATPAGGTVIVRAVYETENDRVTIQVDDTGEGLKGRDPEELFQPFVSTRTRGTGLGLTISRGILQRLGGGLTLEGNPQGGMRCTIRLPRSFGRMMRAGSIPGDGI